MRRPVPRRLPVYGGAIDEVGDPDAADVAAARAGDRRALEALLRRHQPQLLSVCRRLTGSDADAADALQNALIALVRGLPRFDGRSRFSTWAYRVAVNASYDELRSRRRRAERDRADTYLVADGADAGEAAAARADLEAALARLTPDHRAAVVLRDACGLDYAEIAEVLAVPVGTVRSRIARGRAALVEAMTGPGRRPPVGVPTPAARPAPERMVP